MFTFCSSIKKNNELKKGKRRRLDNSKIGIYILTYTYVRGITSERRIGPKVINCAKGILLLTRIKIHGGEMVGNVKQK